MAKFRFLTVWRLDAPIEKVWEAIVDYQQLPTWWSAVTTVTELEPGDAQGIGSVWKITWKTPLSYRLTFTSRITSIAPPHQLELNAVGEVEGTGLWELSATDDGTTVKYYWTVKTTKAWMNTLALVIRPLMEWNHNAIMRSGGQELAQWLGARLINEESITLA